MDDFGIGSAPAEPWLLVTFDIEEYSLRVRGRRPDSDDHPADCWKLRHLENLVEGMVSLTAAHQAETS